MSEVRDLFNRCPEHGARIVSKYEFEDAAKEHSSAGVISAAMLARVEVPEHPNAKLRGTALICDLCDSAATTVHLLPDVVDVVCIKAACDEHDPGGYWFPLYGDDGFRTHPLRWLEHLSGKANGEATIFSIIEWLGYAGAEAMDVGPTS